MWYLHMQCMYVMYCVCTHRYICHMNKFVRVTSRREQAASNAATYQQLLFEQSQHMLSPIFPPHKSNGLHTGDACMHVQAHTLRPHAWSSVCTKYARLSACKTVICFYQYVHKRVWMCQLACWVMPGVCIKIQPYIHAYIHVYTCIHEAWLYPTCRVRLIGITLRMRNNIFIQGAHANTTCTHADYGMQLSCFCWLHCWYTCAHSHVIPACISIYIHA
jgi:hypothetical protein